MVKCEYYGRWFRNKQALRAHLKHCPMKEVKPILDNIEFEKIKFAQSIVKLLKEIEKTKVNRITDEIMNKYKIRREDIKKLLEDPEVKKYILRKLGRL